LPLLQLVLLMPVAGFAAGLGDAGGGFATGAGGTGGGLPLGSALPMSAALLANNRNNIRLQTS
jgi:hypothetical protein